MAKKLDYVDHFDFGKLEEGQITGPIQSGRFDGVSVGRDENGFYCCTHRCRSKSYLSVDKIPKSKIQFIESTGSKVTMREVARVAEIDSEEETLTIDFDGVVHKYSKGWHTGRVYDEPMEGTKEALERLSKTFRLILSSARVHTQGKEEVEEWLAKYGLLEYFDEVTDKKLPSVRYIDDKGLRFLSWAQTLKELEEERLIE